AALDADVRAVYGMGFFDQVDADVSPAGAGQVAVVLRVKERPLVRTLKVEGTDEIEKEEIEGALKVRPRTILDPEKIRQGIEAARKLYIDKGYLDATITYTTTPVGENEVDIVYKVEEKDTIKVEDISFEGNEAFSGRTLRGVMQTRESWIFGFITGAGVLSRDVLRTDVERLTAYYYDHGYVTVKVDEPIVERKDDGLYITIKIAEGDQFKIGKVDIVGADLPPDSIRLREGIETTTGEVFSASALREDSKTVDITFQADRGKPVVIDRIEIEGNTKTRDKVIRREMRLQEQELFSARKLRKSRESLQRLGFFQEVNITTRRAAAEDRMNVVVAVKEAQTGAFSAGAGFSSADSLLFNVRIQENNLFGRGQRVVVNADVGSIRRNIVLSFTEPYFRDTPLTVGVDVFDWRLEFDDFARSGRGASTQFTYPVTALGYDTLWGLPLDEVRVGADYRLEQAEIGDIDFSASRSIRAEEGESLVSSITPRVSRNTLNHAFDPTAGSFQDLGVELAGLGGT